MKKKLFSLLLALTLVLSCIGAVSVSADELVYAGSYSLVANGYGVTSETNPDLVFTPADSATKIPLHGYTTAGDPVENGRNLMYYKFEVGNVDGITLEFLSKVELSVYASGMCAHNLRIYPVANDDWNVETITYNNVYGENSEIAPDTDVHAKGSIDYIGTHMTARRYAFDVTNIIKEEYIEDGVLSFAIGVYSSGNDNQSSYYYEKYSGQKAFEGPKLTFYMDEPVYDSSNKVTQVFYNDYTIVGPSAPDTCDQSLDVYHTLGDSGISVLNNTTGTADSYGKVNTLYLKFDLRGVDDNMVSDISSVTLSLDGAINSRYYDIGYYYVENDNWSGSEMTFTKAFGKAADEEAGTEAIEGQYLPDKNKVVFKKTVNASSYTKVVEQGPVDLTSYVLDELECNGGDGILTIAMMAGQPYNSAGKPVAEGTIGERYFRPRICKAGCNKEHAPETYGPVLNFNFAEASVETSEDIKIKVDGNEAETLSSGVISAEVETTSTLSVASRTVMIMAVYEGNRLSKIYVSPQQKINDKNTNGGKTTITVSSSEEVTVGENTSVSVFMWKDISIPLPLGSVKTIGR